MKPKSRKEILDTCQNNFWNYTTLSKVMIVISVVLSAAAVAYYIVGYVMPTILNIVNGEIGGFEILWKILLGYILYLILQFANIIFISIGGSAVCREENWETIDFAKAWTNIYKYENFLNNNEHTDE
jgi:uncharacterized Tic20 family protein